jgi:hypothetical protein
VAMTSVTTMASTVVGIHFELVFISVPF